MFDEDWKVKIYSYLLALALWGMASASNQLLPGKATVVPSSGIAGHYGTWIVRFEVGPEGISQGGGIRVQLPDSWHAGGRNSANRLQSSDPSADHYVSARASRGDVRLETTVESESDQVLVKAARRGLDGRSERYIFVVRVQLLKGDLHQGDILSVIYGDTSRGSRGVRAAIISAPPEPVLVAIDPTGSGDFGLIPSLPTLESRSGPPVELLLTAPSTLVVGQPARLRVAVLDANSNPVPSFRDEFQLRVPQGRAEIPTKLKLDLTRGWADILFRPQAKGILRIEGSTLGKILQARANPIKVVTREPERKPYWGDLHSHTGYSWDGVGMNSFEYARDISRLDFYAMTDHSLLPEGEFSRGLGFHIWEEYTGLTEQHYDPGHFVTLHAYEASFGPPFGHHNVYFRDQPGPLFAPGQVSLGQLWERLEVGTALTVPHHTGKFPSPVRWEPHNGDFRRNFEIYSAHGLSENYDPEHPLAFEQSDFTAPSRSVTGLQFAQDAWIHGLILSTIAASDDHRSQPGKPHWGLAAVMATGLTRTEIFDALHQRRTYGTTGARILLDFSIDGQSMGQRIVVGGPPHIRIEAHGTSVIESVEVLRYCKTDGVFRIIHRIEPDALDFSWRSLDRTFREDSIYYVRLRQAALIRNRIAMAWSSPIWVSLAAAPPH